MVVIWWVYETKSLLEILENQLDTGYLNSALWYFIMFWHLSDLYRQSRMANYSIEYRPQLAHGIFFGYRKSTTIWVQDILHTWLNSADNQPVAAPVFFKSKVVNGQMFILHKIWCKTCSYKNFLLWSWFCWHFSNYSGDYTPSTGLQLKKNVLFSI